MQSAALLFLASSASVLFGWQPMPDGSPSYEYIVQLEPELVATLKKGQSIPIATDVPKDIRPIGRIRVVVGNNPLPKQKLTITHKPLSDTSAKKSRDGLVLAQHRVSPVQPTGAGRYPSSTTAQPPTTNQIFPPNGNQNNNQGFASAQRNTTQPVGNPSTNPDQILPPDSNSISRQFQNNLQNNLQNTVQNVTQDIGNTVQDSTRSLGHQLRQASDEILPNSQLLFGDKSLQPINQNSQISPAPNGQIFPPGSTSPPQSPIGNTAAASQQAGSRPAFDSRNPSSWKSTQPSSSETRIASNNAQTTPTSTNNFNSNWPRNSQTQAGQTTLPAPPYAQPKNTLGSNRYSNNQPTGTQPTQSNNNTSWATGSNLSTTPGNTALASSPTQSNVPEIRKDMLKQPVGADMELIASRPPNTTTSPRDQRAFQPISTQTPATTQADGQNAQNNGWGQFNNQQQTPTQIPPTDKPNTLMLVLSWVLLSGSGIGNVYLLWNYFDVRQKYRGLVHNARGSSRSYSPHD